MCAVATVLSHLPPNLIPPFVLLSKSVFFFVSVVQMEVRVRALSMFPIFILALVFSFRIVVLGREEETISPALCPRVGNFSPVEAFFHLHHSCQANGEGRGLDLAAVVEGDEATLHRVFGSVQKDDGGFIAVLFYASWCSFSKICRPNFNTVSSLFPEIHHFAFEESAIRPSMLSRYGVHGFPTIFLLNSTIKARYRGPRTVNSFIAFYSNNTGIDPRPLDHTYPGEIIIPLNKTGHIQEMEENCPFSWARSPEKMLQQDTYLALASAFLLFRLLCVFLPKIVGCVKLVWRNHIRYASLITLSHVCLEQTKYALCQLNPYGKRRNLQEGALSARSWANKSLASVSIGEPSSARIHSICEKR